MYPSPVWWAVAAGNARRPAGGARGASINGEGDMGDMGGHG